MESSSVGRRLAESTSTAARTTLFRVPSAGLVAAGRPTAHRRPPFQVNGFKNCRSSRPERRHSLLVNFDNEGCLGFNELCIAVTLRLLLSSSSNQRPSSALFLQPRLFQERNRLFVNDRASAIFLSLSRREEHGGKRDRLCGITR